MSGLTGGLLVSPQHLNPPDLSHMAAKPRHDLVMSSRGGEIMFFGILVIEISQCSMGKISGHCNTACEFELFNF